MPKICLPALVWMLAVTAVTGSLPAAEPDRQFTLILTSHLLGRLEDEFGVTIASVVETVVEETAQAKAEGRVVAMVNAGPTFSPYAESRWGGEDTMLEALRDADCAAYAVSPLDALALGPERMNHFAGSGSPPFLFPAGMSRSAKLLEIRLDTGEGPPVILTSAMDTFFAGNLRAAGFEVDEEAMSPVPEDAGLRVVIYRSRESGPVFLNRRGTWNLATSGEADVVIAPQFGKNVSARLDNEGRPTILVGLAPRPVWRVTRIDLDLRLVGDEWGILDWRVLPLHIDPGAGDDTRLAEGVREMMREFRAAHSKRMPEEAPRTPEGLRGFTMETLREAFRAEIAILPEESLRPVSPIHFTGEPVTEEAILRFLSIDNPVVLVSLTGSELEELAAETSRRSRSRLLFKGLDFTVESPGTLLAQVADLTVNGQPLIPEDRYRVATSDYLLHGFGNYVPLIDAVPIKHHPESLPQELRDDFVIPRLAVAGRPFADLTKKGLWRFGTERLTFFFDNVTTDRDQAYEDTSDSKAAASDSLASRGEFGLRADYLKTGWRWRNRLWGEFGLVRANSLTTEQVDDIGFETAVLFDRQVIAGSPFLGLELDSEFRRNEREDGTLSPRQFEQTLKAGLDWSFARWTELDLAFVARHFSQFDRPNHYGMTSRARYLMAPASGRPGFEMYLMAEHLRGAGDDSSTITRFEIDLRFPFPLWRKLAFLPAVNYYYRDESILPGAARYLSISLGLEYGWRNKYQLWGKLPAKTRRSIYSRQR